MQTKNEVLVVGKIISRREGKTKDYITVFTRNGRKEVFAKFTCEKGMLLPDLSRVKIKGHIERPTRRRGNNFISEQILIADSISPLKTLTESAFGVKGKFFPDAEAKAYFCGNIKNVSKTKAHHQLV